MLRNFPLCCIVIVLLITACTANASGEPVDPPMQQASNGSVVESVEVSGPTGSTKPATVEIIGGDEASLREFMQWYLANPGSTGSTRAFIGSLPDDLTIDVP